MLNNYFFLKIFVRVKQSKLVFFCYNKLYNFLYFGMLEYFYNPTLKQKVKKIIFQNFVANITNFIFLLCERTHRVLHNGSYERNKIICRSTHRTVQLTITAFL